MRSRRSLFDWSLRLLRLDGPLLATILVLMGIGLLVLYSAGEHRSDLIVRQLFRLGLALSVAIALAQIPPRMLRYWSPFLYLLAILLLVAVLVMGVGRGAQRWLDFGFIRFQPSELMKLALPMTVAWLFHSQRLPPRWWLVLAGLIIIGVPAMMIGMQPDLGTALLVGGSGMAVIFLAGVRWRYLLAGAGLAAAAAPALWLVMKDYQRDRIRTFLDPASDPLGQGWNIIQSQIAVGSGGFFGKGWMQGSQSHLEFLPESHTDFILAVLAEEFGLVGVITIFLLYLIIVGRGLYIASQARDTYGRLLAGSLSLTFFVYVTVNAGMVSGILPVVGVPLPLISYGGTSAVTLMAGFGLMMAIHNHRRIWS
ncbi:MAG: peptidoglycan glycosyltransferase MrdB [Wenzhouxiangellaceae bacterium]